MDNEHISVENESKKENGKAVVVKNSEALREVTAWHILTSMANHAGLFKNEGILWFQAFSAKNGKVLHKLGLLAPYTRPSLSSPEIRVLNQAVNNWRVKGNK